MKDYKEQVIEFYQERGLDSVPSKLGLTQRINEIATSLRAIFDYRAYCSSKGEKIREDIHTHLACIAIGCILLAKDLNIDLNDVVNDSLGQISMDGDIYYPYKIDDLKAGRRKLVKYMKKRYDYRHMTVGFIYTSSLYLAHHCIGMSEEHFSKIANYKESDEPIYIPFFLIRENEMMMRIKSDRREISNDLACIYLNCILIAYSLSQYLDDIILNALEQARKENPDIMSKPKIKELILPHQ